MSDVNTLACTVYGETLDLPDATRSAVANVVVNRVAQSGSSPGFGTGTVASACLAPGQFECWTDPAALAAIRAADASDPAFAACLAVAAEAIAGTLPDATDDATYYYAGNQAPAWARGLTPCARVGGLTLFQTPSTPAPSPTPQQLAEAAIAGGVVVTSAGTPALDATYAVGPTQQGQINAVVTYVLVNGSFPASLPELPWPDASGAMRYFTSTAQFQAFASAVANFVAVVTIYGASGGAVGSIPSNAVTIP